MIWGTSVLAEEEKVRSLSPKLGLQANFRFEGNVEAFERSQIGS